MNHIVKNTYGTAESKKQTDCEAEMKTEIYVLANGHNQLSLLV
jgi:hypothetical protein